MYNTIIFKAIVSIIPNLRSYAYLDTSMIWKVSALSVVSQFAWSTEWGVGPTIVDLSMVDWIGDLYSVDQMADSAFLPSMFGMVEGSVSWSNESIGGSNSSDSRISVNRMAINTFSLGMVFVMTIYNQIINYHSQLLNQRNLIILLLFYLVK